MLFRSGLRIAVRRIAGHHDVVRAGDDIKSVPAVVVGLAVCDRHIRTIVDRKPILAIIVRDAVR